MNKIVREHYPVEKLPVDLQAAIGAAQTVTVTIESEVQDPVRKSPSELFAEMESWRDRMPHRELSDAAARIRKLRDEWDE
jgi:hypothetical protein